MFLAPAESQRVAPPPVERDCIKVDLSSRLPRTARFFFTVPHRFRDLAD